MESCTGEKTSKEQTAQRLAGSCLCGASKYTVLNQPIKMIVCHCINCKKFSGIAFSANIWFPLASFRPQDAASLQIRKYADSNTDTERTLNRHFCGTCGCSMYITVPHNPAIISIFSGTIDGLWCESAGGPLSDTGAELLQELSPEVELYCPRKPHWVEITSSAKKFQAQ
jgi:hypothetical protein